MREWIKDWMELPYISPYDDASHLDQASPEMEKRMVGAFHELLSLPIYKRIPVPILGKFCEEYRFSNAFSSVFTRHSGLFYLSLKGGIQTAMLRDAFNGEELVDGDPFLEIKDKFIEFLDEGRNLWQLGTKCTTVRSKMLSCETVEVAALQNSSTGDKAIAAVK